MSDAICTVCEAAYVFARGRCHACLKYWQRHGHERTEKLIVAHGQRLMERNYRRCLLS